MDDTALRLDIHDGVNEPVTRGELIAILETITNVMVATHPCHVAAVLNTLTKRMNEQKWLGASEQKQ